MQKLEDPFKNEGIRVVTTFFPFQVYGNFSRHSRAANSATQNVITKQNVLKKLLLYFDLLAHFRCKLITGSHILGSKVELKTKSREKATP